MPSKKIDYARPVYIVDGCRTPFLRAKGKPGPFKHTDLGVFASRALLEKMPFEANEIDEVIFGSSMPGSDEANISRLVALRIGCGNKVPAYTVNRNCASGLQSLDNAALSIADGRSNLILAGGIEAMSQAPLLLRTEMVNWLSDLRNAKKILDKLRVFAKIRPSLFAPVPALINGLNDPIVGLSMGQTAEKIAHRFGINREMMDNYSVQSHNRLHQAQINNRLTEVVPIFDTNGCLYETDDGVRPNSSVERLSKLKPVFDFQFGSVTAGNSSQISDGASSLILASADAVEKYNLPILARMVTTQWAGLAPDEMGLGPAHAIAPLLRSRRINVGSIDFWEINEAFSAQVLAVVEALKDKAYCQSHLGLKTPIGQIPMDKLNVNGGGISLGHPVGASGARITLHLAKILEQTNSKRGIASLCIGGGQGGAVLLEREKSK